MASDTQKLKLLNLLRIFFEETDDAHGLAMSHLIEMLEEAGVPAERKSIYRDIKVLKEFGLDIQTLKRHPVEYALVTRSFSLPELLLLADAVQSSRFLTETKSRSLMKSLKTLGSRHQGIRLARSVHVEGRIKMQNESVFSNVDIIQEAIKARRKLSFLYFRYDADKKQQLRHRGEPYRETPIKLVYSEGYYYLVTYNDKHRGFTNYRVDRMLSLAITDEASTRNEDIANYDVSESIDCSFGMYRGTKRKATLLVHENAMNGVIDRFGKKVRTSAAFEVADPALSECGSNAAQAQGTQPQKGYEPGRWTRIHVDIMESPPFFAWVAQFGRAVRIEKPAELARSYRDYLCAIISAYDE